MYFTMMTRNLFCYGMFKASPWMFQPLMYDFGKYNSVLDLSDITQQFGGNSIADGYLYPFMSEYYALGAMTSSYAMGSAVKGATVLTGLQTGAINLNTTFLDDI